MHRIALTLVLLVGIASTGTGQARADEPWNFVQITCVPELGYFSIRKILIMNLPHKGPYLTDGFTAPASAVSALQSKYRIFEGQALSTHPLTCIIPHLDVASGWEQEREGFEVKVVGHFDEKNNSPESSYCRMTDSVEVLVNGKSSGSIVLNPCENGPMLVSVEVSHDGVELAIRRCTRDPLADHSPDQQQTVCREEPLAKVQ